ncbi:hypothetical protein DFH06DRAFT_388366 [Mycena polygramma]|nr:hypothetical protein DFH06DRAFT_388366 [Mycena polygramma]
MAPPLSLSLLPPPSPSLYSVLHGFLTSSSPRPRRHHHLSHPAPHAIMGARLDVESPSQRGLAVTRDSLPSDLVRHATKPSTCSIWGPVFGVFNYNLNLDYCSPNSTLFSIARGTSTYLWGVGTNVGTMIDTKYICSLRRTRLMIPSCPMTSRMV